MVRDYRDSNKKWTNATVINKKGPLFYDMETQDKGIWKQHADQMENTDCEPKPSQIIASENIETNFEKMDTCPFMPSNETLNKRYPQRIRKPPDRLSYN